MFLGLTCERPSMFNSCNSFMILGQSYPCIHIRKSIRLEYFKKKKSAQYRSKPLPRGTLCIHQCFENLISLLSLSTSVQITKQCSTIDCRSCNFIKHQMVQIEVGRTATAYFCIRKKIMVGDLCGIHRLSKALI